jgi:Zn-dependent peptidase ImmA (M78 family)/transcriptional regulator with XRE-family HTH domain
MSSPFAGERLRTAREIFGVTQDELHHRAGLSQSLLSQVERGQKPASADLIRGVATGLGLPLSFFDVVPDDVPLDSLRFRKQKTASALTTRRAQALFQEGFRVSRILVERSRYPRPVLPYATGEITEEDIVDLAAQTRDSLHVAQDKPIPHLMRAVERAGIPVAPIVLPYPEESPLSKNQHFGLSYWGGPNEHGFIGYFPGHSGDRDRFTLAHELGHLVLHLRRRAVDPELEANLFAGELLMPSDRARETLSMGLTLSDYGRIKAVWGVSMQGLIMRAKRLGLITEDRSTSLWKQLNARGWRRQEPVTVQPERPALLPALRTHVFGDRPLRDLEEVLALPLVLLKSLLDPEPARIEERGDNVVNLASRQSRL